MPAAVIIQVPLHHFKNYGFAVIDRIRIRAVFPELRSLESPYNARLTIAQRVSWYEDVLYIAVMRIIEKSYFWPVSYANRLFNSRGIAGELVLAPIEVREQDFPLLLAEIHAILNNPNARPEIRVFRGFGLYWELQDEKQSTWMDANDNDWRENMEQQCIPTMFRNFNLDLIDGENIDVDVAVEYRHKDKSLYFRRDAHTILVDKLLGFSPGRIEAFLAVRSSGAQYQCDNVAGLDAIAGFHANFKGKRTPKHAMYCQCYTSDKSMRYQSRGINKQAPLSAKWFLRPPSTSSLAAERWLIETEADLLSAIQNHTPSVLRVEVTVPFSKMTEAAPLFGTDTLESVALALPIEAML